MPALSPGSRTVRTVRETGRGRTKAAWKKRRQSRPELAHRSLGFTSDLGFRVETLKFAAANI